MDLDIYRGKGDATPKKTNFSSGGERKKEEKKKNSVLEENGTGSRYPSLPSSLWNTDIHHAPSLSTRLPLIALYLAIPSTDRQLPPIRSCTSVKKATRSLHHRELCLVRPLPPSSHRVLHFYVAPVEGRPPSPLRRSFPPPRSYST